MSHVPAVRRALCTHSRVRRSALPTIDRAATAGLHHRFMPDRAPPAAERGGAVAVASGREEHARPRGIGHHARASPWPGWPAAPPTVATGSPASTQRAVAWAGHPRRPGAAARLDVLSARGCGVALPRQRGGACLAPPGPVGRSPKLVRPFGTLTDARLALADWLAATGCTHVAMAPRTCRGRRCRGPWPRTSASCWRRNSPRALLWRRRAGACARRVPRGSGRGQPTGRGWTRARGTPGGARRWWKRRPPRRRPRARALAAQQQRLAPRRGGQQAAVARGRRLVIVCHLLREQAVDHARGVTPAPARDRDQAPPRLVHCLEQRGGTVTITPAI